jgi:surfactin synthase thioesterase subunit
MTNTNLSVIALPFAGGNCYSYVNFEKIAPEGVEWITLELPGRGRRISEEILDSTKDQVDDIFRQMSPYTTKGNYILYGHSMGGLLAYELARMLTEKQCQLPVFLFITGRNAPSGVYSKKLSQLSSDLLWENVLSMGGVSQELANNDDLKDFFEPVLRADFRSIENYEYVKKPKLNIPIYLRAGSEENISVESLRGWQDETVAEVDIALLEGNHFFIYDHKEHLLGEMISNAEVSLGKV